MDDDTARVPEERLVLEEFFPYRLTVLALNVSRAMAAGYRTRFGLSIAEWRVMANLGHRAPITANQVAAHAALDKVQTSRAVARLMEGGLVERTTDPRDRRRGLLQLSERGREVYGRIVPLARACEVELLGALDPEERRMLFALCARLDDKARALQGGCDGKGGEGEQPLPDPASVV